MARNTLTPEQIVKNIKRLTRCKFTDETKILYKITGRVKRLVSILDIRPLLTTRWEV